MQPGWEAGDELIITKTHFMQEWAITEKERKGKTPVTVKDLGIPTEYKQHTAVFSEEGAKRFPPS
jgi:hypothetical protein